MRQDGRQALSETVFTDSHAHLPDVVGRIGAEGLAGLFAGYAAAGDAPAAGGAGVAGVAGATGAVVAPDAGPLLVDIGTEADDFASRLALLGRHGFLRYSLGVWPGREALEDPPASLALLEASVAVAGADAAAIGECGLDYHHMDGPREAQLALFEGQAALALRLGLPLIVHSREAFEDTISVVSRLRRGECGSDGGHRVDGRHPGAADGCPALPVIIHCFGYGPEEALRFLELGCHVSFAGNVTYKKADALREALRLVPLDRLLLETDSPYMNPEPLRGRPCSPRDIGRTYAFAASLRGEDEGRLAAAVTANARSLFRDRVAMNGAAR
jgi:TatD DNase family protein